MTKKRHLTRRQHIVPCLLLANFTDAAESLWVYSKGKPARPSIAENECCERDFYEYELNGRPTENQYEEWLARIESDASTVSRMIVARQQLSQCNAEIWATFVAVLFARTRKVRMQISGSIVRKFKKETDDPNFVRDMQYELLQKGELVPAADLKKQVDRLRAAMDASPSFYHVSGLPRYSASLAQPLLRKMWHTIDAPAGKSFLISDCPVMTLEITGSQILTGAGFANEKVAILVPLSPQTLFVASPPNADWRPTATTAGVDNVNRLIAMFGHRNVYANANSIDTQLLVDTHLDALKFGVNAFLPAAG